MDTMCFWRPEPTGLQSRGPRRDLILGKLGARINGFPAHVPLELSKMAGRRFIYCTRAHLVPMVFPAVGLDGSVPQRSIVGRASAPHILSAHAFLDDDGHI